MTIVNSGTEDDVLVGIDGTAFSEVRVTGSASGTVSASPSGAATTTPPAQATTSSGSRALDITVPARQSVFLGENAPTVTLASLGQGLTPAQTMDLTFTFEKAGNVTVTVPVAVPASNVPQTSTFNFHVPTEANIPDDQAG
jgi:copper(I)-binding protein